MFCLGQFIIKIYPPTPVSFPELPQPVFLQRGTRRVHVWCSSNIKFGDLSEAKSYFLGPLLGPIGSCLLNISKEATKISDQNVLRFRVFVVTTGCPIPQLRGCIFSSSKIELQIFGAFKGASLDLTPIWNYDFNLFFNIPHTTACNQIVTAEHQNSDILLRHHCLANLRKYQLKELQFLYENETVNMNTFDNFWLHRNNNWIQERSNQNGTELVYPHNTCALGSILADDMCLGKTLTTLALILKTSNHA